MVVIVVVAVTGSVVENAVAVAEEYRKDYSWRSVVLERVPAVAARRKILAERMGCLTERETFAAVVLKYMD